MRCIKCGAQNPEVAKFCAACGTGLQKGLAEEQQADHKKLVLDELIGNNDKLFFLVSAAGGAILFFAGLVASMAIAPSDPLFSMVLRILSFSCLGYALVITTIFIFLFWPLLKGSKGSAGGSDLSSEAGDLKKALDASPVLKKARLGGAAFAAVLLLVVIITALLPRAQFSLVRVFDQEEIVYGDPIMITAFAENYGRAAGNMELSVLIDGEEVQHESILIEPGIQRHYEIVLSGDYQPGTYQYRIGLGPARTISLDHGGQFRVLTPPEFKVRRLSLVPNQFDFNEIQKTVVKVEIDNVGEAAGTYHLTLEKDGQKADTMYVHIPGQGKRTAELPLIPDGPGSYALAVNGISEVLEVYNLERPRNGNIMLNKISGGYGHLTVVNNMDVDVLFVYSRSSEPLETVLAVYVHADSRTTVRGIRDGDYIAYYSTGLDWDSHSKKFTRSADHGRYEEEFDYKTIHRGAEYTYRTWKAEFGVISTGTGASTFSVSPDNFPQISD